MWDPSPSTNSLNSIASDRYNLQLQDTDQLQQTLERKHIIMIAIAGVIGTGLFLGSGKTLNVAGPLGSLLGYILIASVVYASLFSATELTVWAPVSGTLPHFATRWVDPALGFVLGWNYFFFFVIASAAQMAAATILITFWQERLSPVAMLFIILGFCAAVIISNILAVRYFGNIEVIFSTIKFCLFVVLVITGLVLDLKGGQDRIGGQRWNKEDLLGDPNFVASRNLKPSVHHFFGFFSGLINIAFSFQAMELVLLAASETRNPRRNIPKASKKLFWIVTVVYVVGILIAGLLVPWNHPLLLDGDEKQNATFGHQSPFVIAMDMAMVKGLPHIVNAGILVSALSACNASVFAASRIVYGSALRGHAPKQLRFTRNHVPLFAIAASSCLLLLSLMCIKEEPRRVLFDYLVHFTGSGGLLNWASMNLTYIFFHRGLVAQKLNPEEYGYHHPWQPWLSYWGFGWSLILITFSGLELVHRFDIGTLFSSYSNVVVCGIAYLVYKWIKKTRILKPEEMDFVRGIPSLLETEQLQRSPKTRRERFENFIF